MALEQILPSLYRVPLKAVNAFVIDLGDDGLVLIDAGTPDDTKAILDVVGELGRRSADVLHILVTHCHADHAGGLAELKKATGAPAYMHPADAEMVRVGRALRPLTPTPGPLNRAVFWLFLRNGPKTLPATGVEHEVSDGEVLPFAGGIRAVHAPGHCDLEEGRRSAKKLAELDFETACFGHGRAIRRGASARFRKAFGVGQKATAE